MYVAAMRSSAPSATKNRGGEHDSWRSYFSVSFNPSNDESESPRSGAGSRTPQLLNAARQEFPGAEAVCKEKPTEAQSQWLTLALLALTQSMA